MGNIHIWKSFPNVKIELEFSEGKWKGHERNGEIREEKECFIRKQGMMRDCIGIVVLMFSSFT